MWCFFADVVEEGEEELSIFQMVGRKRREGGREKRGDGGDKGRGGG